MRISFMPVNKKKITKTKSKSSPPKATIGKVQLPSTHEQVNDIIQNIFDKNANIAELEDYAARVSLANLLKMSLEGDSEKTKIDAANSILDRLNKPRMSAQFKKSENTTLNHKDIVKFLSGSKSKGLKNNDIIEQNDK